jgi:hypothetical protein
MAAGALFCPQCGAEQREGEGRSLGDQRTLGGGARRVGDQPTLREVPTRRFKAGDKVLRRYRVLSDWLSTKATEFN